MRTRVAELAELVEAGAQQVVGALRGAAAEGLTPRELTDLLSVALRQRNRIDAAITTVVGAVDVASDRADDAGDLTMGLSCASWLAHNLHISPSAAHAQVHLARQLPSMPATAAAFERGDLSPQHAGVVARSVERVARGGGDARAAEDLLLQDASG